MNDTEAAGAIEKLVRGSLRHLERAVVAEAELARLRDLLKRVPLSHDHPLGALLPSQCLGCAILVALTADADAGEGGTP